MTKDKIKQKFQEIKTKAKEKLEDPFVWTTIVSVGTLVGVLAHQILKDVRYQRSMSIWSFGKDSILKISATDEEAAAYNRIVQAFFDAEMKSIEEIGETLKPIDFATINVNSKDREIYNLIVDRINEALEYIDQDGTPIEILDDFLVKNPED